VAFAPSSNLLFNAWSLAARVKRLSALFIFALLLSLTRLTAQTNEAGSVAGSVIDQASGKPVEYATVALQPKDGTETVRSAVTDNKGAFTVENVPFGDYRAVYGHLGADGQPSAVFTVDAQHRAVDIGRLAIGDTAIKMEKFQVKTDRETFANSIDRKVYNVSKDLMASTESASEALQNIPSVQVDIDGNVSLRGNDNVLILIDGKPSAMMNSANRAMTLEQLPADSIERIEVITNPSAKYKPDGTAGIINVVMKKKHEPGYAASVRATVGNDSRYTFGASANYNPGRYNFYASLNVRQDDRPRFVQDYRSHLDPTTNTVLTTSQITVEHMRPLSRLGQLGGDYRITDADKIGVNGEYNYRTFFRTSTITNVSHDANGNLTGDYDRDRQDPEWQKTTEISATWQHSFAQEGQDLDLELKQNRHWEQEANHYSDVYRTPITPTTYDTTLIKPTETGTNLTADYSQPFAHEAKLDAGYSFETNKNDMDYRSGYLDPVSGLWMVDTTQTNRFIYHDHIHALYATFGRPVGNFGFLAGLRFEQAIIDTDQVTTAVVNKDTYVRLYPTLHLSYNLTEASQLQLSYSHRIHRPESDDLNPFPEYQDPFNLRAGNPHLMPEETHSIEAGYQYKKDNTTYLAAVYYRESYHSFTTITQYVDPVTLLPSADSLTLLTMQQNLSSSRSGGIELAVSGDLGSKITVNFSSNIYENQIDASNLGYSTNKSAIAWNAKFNMSWHATKTNMFQVNSNYTAKRLTPQGYRMPTFIANVGYKHQFNDKQTAFVLTVSDLFDSLKERTIIDTPTLHDDTTRRRSSRIIYAGFVYSFGKIGKKKKDDSMQFDDKL